MINRIYNLIIYAHFVKLCISNHIKDDTAEHFSKWLSDHNDVIHFQREYLQEKAHKYLGDVDFGEIDHNKIIDTYYGNKSADDLSILDIESLLTSLPIMKVSDRANLSPETTDDSFCKGWVVDRFKVIGCDHETTSDIEEYLYYLGEEGQDRIIELLRDLQIQECLK